MGRVVLMVLKAFICLLNVIAGGGRRSPAQGDRQGDGPPQGSGRPGGRVSPCSCHCRGKRHPGAHQGECEHSVLCRLSLFPYSYDLLCVERDLFSLNVLNDYGISVY